MEQGQFIEMRLLEREKVLAIAPLWSAGVLDEAADAVVDAEGASTQIYLPWDVELVAIDGETQLAARFEAAKINSATTKQMVDVKQGRFSPGS